MNDSMKWSKGDKYIGIKVYKIDLGKPTCILSMHLMPVQINFSFSKWFMSVGIIIFKFKLSIGCGV